MWSGLCETATASTRTLPAALALTVTENCAEVPLASAAVVQVNTLACRAQLAVFKVPKAVHVVAELPVDAQGKILKRELR